MCLIWDLKVILVVNLILVLWSEGPYSMETYCLLLWSQFSVHLVQRRFLQCTCTCLCNASNCPFFYSWMGVPWSIFLINLLVCVCPPIPKPYFWIRCSRLDVTVKCYIVSLRESALYRITLVLVDYRAVCKWNQQMHMHKFISSLLNPLSPELNVPQGVGGGGRGHSCILATMRCKGHFWVWKEQSEDLFLG